MRGCAKPRSTLLACVRNGSPGEWSSAVPGKNGSTAADQAATPPQPHLPDGRGGRLGHLGSWGHREAQHTHLPANDNPTARTWNLHCRLPRSAQGLLLAWRLGVTPRGGQRDHAMLEIKLGGPQAKHRSSPRSHSQRPLDAYSAASLATPLWLVTACG